MSGGLDSALAVRLILEQGIEVIGISFVGAYCPVPLQGRSAAEVVSGQLGIRLVQLSIDQGFIDMVGAPRYGHGRNMNPCIDCHIMMVQRAWEWGQNHGAAFVFTGEVLGQRPMSQRKQGLMLVAKRSGADGYLLRPLSAKLLEPTIVEQEGLVAREQLLDIQGRTRRRQFELVREYGLTGFASPAGGCLLTDRGFARRVREAFDHDEARVEVVELLRFGRHFRLASGARVVVGRNREENEALLRYRPPGAVVVDGQHLPGPAALLMPGSVADRIVAARLVARYSDRRGSDEVAVRIGTEELMVCPATPDESAALLIE
jgi:tRNA U34 2-thiouridine synthase MnmA/TrmU